MKPSELSDKGGVEFLASHLGVSTSAIYAAMRRGDSLPPCIQIGTRKVWRLEAIQGWIEKNETAPKPDVRRSEIGSIRKKEIKLTPLARRGRPTKKEQVEGRA